MRDHSTVLVLWTNYFDEVAATGLATSLRRSGIRVKLAGVGHGGATGAGGLTLVPDLTLEQAIELAGRTALVVVPASAGAVRRLGDDPRVRELLARAQANGAVFVTSVEAAPELAALAGADRPLDIRSYTACESPAEFADRLVAALPPRRA